MFLPKRDRQFFVGALPVFALLWVLVIFGCSPDKAPAGAAATGTIATSAQLTSEFGSGTLAGDVAYARVSEKWAREFYKEFRDELFKKGVVKWNERFDCNHFASYYVSLAQIRFYLDNWGKSTPASTLAVGVYWFIPASQAKRDKPVGHAVVAFLTDAGPRFLEPQSGELIELTPSEKASAYVKIF